MPCRDRALLLATPRLAHPCCRGRQRWATAWFHPLAGVEPVVGPAWR